LHYFVLCLLMILPQCATRIEMLFFCHFVPTASFPRSAQFTHGDTTLLSSLPSDAPMYLMKPPVLLFYPSVQNRHFVPERFSFHRILCFQRRPEIPFFLEFRSTPTSRSPTPPPNTRIASDCLHVFWPNKLCYPPLPGFSDGDLDFSFIIRAPVCKGLSLQGGNILIPTCPPSYELTAALRVYKELMRLREFSSPVS